MGSTRLVWVLRVTAAAVLLGAAPAAGQGEPTVEEVRAWFLKALDEAAEVEPLGEVRLTFEIGHLVAASDAQLAEWRQEVEGKPQHPLRQRIEAEERRRRHGPDRTRRTIWFLDERHWRLSQDAFRGDALPNEFDTAQSGSRSWQLQPDHLTYYGPERSAPNNVIELHKGIIDDTLNWLMAGALRRARLADRDSLEVEITGDSWTAIVFNREYGADWTVRGVWDHARNVGLIERIEERRADSTTPFFVGEFSDWRWEPLLQRNIAWKAITSKSVPHETLSEFQIVELVAEPRNDILSIVTPPDAFGEDPVRGALRVNRLSDFRPSVARAMDLDVETGGILGSSSLEHLVVRRSNTWLRSLGWVAAGALVSALVVLRVRTQRQGAERKQT